MKEPVTPTMSAQAKPSNDQEGSTLIQVTSALPPDVWAKADEEASREDRTMAAQIRRIVVAFYRNQRA
jgi:hypothetical protein